MALNRTCKGICRQYRVTKPAGDRYYSGQARCQTCDIWIDHRGCHIQDGTPASVDDYGWFCNCCNYRIRKKPRNKKYKEKLQQRKSQENIDKTTKLTANALKILGHFGNAYLRDLQKILSVSDKKIEQMMQNSDGYLTDSIKTSISDKNMDKLVTRLIQTRGITKKDIRYDGKTLEVLFEYNNPKTNMVTSDTKKQNNNQLQSIYDKFQKHDAISDNEFEQIFMNILDFGAKNNTYKFAFTRFLLQYSNEYTKTHVEFSTIAEYFLRYYWSQTCKSKLKQKSYLTQKPRIIQIIEDEFDEPYYPQTFDQIKQIEPRKIQRCIEKIVQSCFHNVIWRFQKIKMNKTNKELKIFYDYKLDRVILPNKYVDLGYGIVLNPQAMQFFKRRYVGLSKIVTLEWVRFLEKWNLGIPRLADKTEKEIAVDTNLAKYRKELEPFFKNCFYCKDQLSDSEGIRVEHVIPFDYIAENNIWNLTLACKKCDLKKTGLLPSENSLHDLIERNKNYSRKIPMLKDSLEVLGTRFEEIISEHYANAKSHGYAVWE